MPHKADKPPLADWELHKGDIQCWISQYPWSVVIEKMKETHNFVASPEQYDAQMRVWGIHKNLKKHEWRGAFHEFDKLASRHRRKIRMRILDKVVPEDKMQRSRYRYCQSDSDDPSVVPSHISFDVLGADGTWSLCTSNEENSDTPQPSTSKRTVETVSPAINLFSPGSPHNDATSINQRPENRVPASINESPDPALRCSSKSTLRGFGLITMDVAHESDQQNTHIPCDSSMNPSWTPLEFSMSDDLDLGLLFPSFLHSYSDLLNGLCFKWFQIDLHNNGIDLTTLGSKTIAKQSVVTSKFVSPFLRDIAASTTKTKRSIQYVQSKTLLHSFQSLLPGEAFKERYGNHADLITKDAIFETNFTRLLIFSIVNGFAGLEQIPIESILKFLSRYGNVGALFAQILKANPSYVAKSLAENLFKVAIEAQEIHIVKHLFETRLLQINNVVCEAYGEKLTAVERVAQLHNLKIMKVLLDAHADVNKTLASKSTNGGPLKRLIDKIHRGETLLPDVMSLVQALLQAGAKVHEEFLQHVIQVTRHSELTFCLLSEFLLTHDTDLILEGMLSLVTLELEEEQACKSIEQILQACERLHKGRCLRVYMGQVEEALVQSAKRGHLQVVQIMLPHSRSLHGVLSASLRSGRREVIDVIMARKPNFNVPAQSIDQVWRRLNDGKAFRWGETTPLAEAIGTEINDLIHLCEEAGALGYLHLSGHFGAALAAAATTGNLPYIHKLLQHRPRPCPKEMVIALVYSIQNGHDDISLVLIKTGAAVDIPSNGSDEPPTPLFAAILQRNARVVRAILDCGDLDIQLRRTSGLLYNSTAFGEAVRWGDRSIILDLHFAFPREKIRHFNSNFLEETLWAGNAELLTFLIDHNLVENSALTSCLPGLIKHNNTAMVIRLIELGADPSDSKNLSLAAKDQPDILQILLEHIPRPERQVVAGLGTNAIKVTIEAGLAGLHALDLLLSSQVVDLRGFGEHMEDWDFPLDFRVFREHTQGCDSPLGLAIKKAEEYQGGFPIVVRLLDAGCDPNSVVSSKTYNNPSNLTALLAAVQTKNINLVRLLLKYGAEVNTMTTRGLTRTPLQRAAELGCLEIVQLLLNEGADVNALPVQRGGGTALQLGAISGNCNLVVEILNHGADAFASPSTIHGRWPIEGAAEHGRLEMIDFLLKASLYDAEQCKRAVEFAQNNGHMGCRDLILDHVNMDESMDMIF